MNEKLDIDVKTLKPFTKFIYTIGVLPTSYLMSMTYEEQLIWLCNYLTKTVIPTINNNAKAVKEVQDLVTELQEYINNYFDNLDVQEEINNKLDDMAESGDLAQILANYVGLIRIFDTTTDLINETSTLKVQNGYIVKTYGYNNIGDGGATDILITNIIPNDKFYFELQNNLYGIPLTNLENVLIYGIKGDSETDNTTLINNIINYTNKLYFPKGTYLFNKINLTDKNNFELYGDGFSSEIKTNNPDTTNFFSFIDLENGTYHVHDLKINSNYIGINNTIALINTNNSNIENCHISGATSQRTINVQTYSSNYGKNNEIKNNIVLKEVASSNSGALIECTGELDNQNNLQYLENTHIINNKCICTSTSYTGDIDLFDCIETDNCKNTIISNNYCENSMHHGISMDTRNINTICTNNTCISTSVLSSGARNGIEVTGTQGASLQNGIISNNIIKNFASNGISVNARNYTVTNNRIDTSNRGIILLELCTEGNIISNNICTNIADYGIYVSSTTAGARITDNNASIYVGSGSGGLLYITSPMSSVNNFSSGLSRILYLNGIHKNDNYSGLNNTGFALDLLSDGRLLFRNPTSGNWQSITKTDI